MTWVPDHKTYMEDGLVREARAADREGAVMSERIDHAAEARRVLDNIPHENILGDHIALAWGQVHATLALVEQQRIANLIEMASFSHDGENDQRIFTNLKAAERWRLEAGEALGLS